MQDKLYTKQTVLFKILIFGLLFAALHIILERTQATVTTDIAFRPLTVPLNFAIILCDATSFFVLYAYVQFSVAHFGRKQSAASCLLIIALAIAKHIANWLIFLTTENITKAYEIHLSWYTAISSISIEVFQHALVIAACLFFLAPHRDQQKASRHARLTICAIMLLFNIVSRIILDIDYGAPNSFPEVLAMIAYYLFDILLYGVVAYLTMIMVEKHEKKKFTLKEADR